ncbi:hypothetical protein LX95_02924 [Mesonia algae]|uniref:Uncharacterized protein n=1 Tax=Mesonia algae TaxID=213248 RepID=A0A2W7HTK4_9FLAO|nr:hypothetical protein [Mesonia algae]PZW36919.1 hypothetical protein LX95_02924 [Mesonia algae]
MNEHLKITTQDGLVFFNDFDKRELIYYKKKNGNLVINIEVSADSTERTNSEKNLLEKNLNENLHPEADECWIELRLFHTEIQEIEELIDLIIEIDKGYEINTEYDSVAHYGIWSPKELFENEIRFEKQQGELKVIWKALSNDVNYYNHKAKKCNMELKCFLNIIGFNSESEYWEYEKKKLGV